MSALKLETLQINLLCDEYDSGGSRLTLPKVAFESLIEYSHRPVKRILAVGHESGEMAIYNVESNSWTATKMVVGTSDRYPYSHLVPIGDTGDGLLFRGGLYHLSAYIVHLRNIKPFTTEIILPRVEISTHETNLRNMDRLIPLNLRDGRIICIRPGDDEISIFDPATPRGWARVQLPKIINYYAAAVVLQNGEILISGGTTNFFGVGETTGCEIYNVTTNTFRRAANMTILRSDTGMCLLPDGRVLMHGEPEWTPQPWTCEIYDPTTNTWSTFERTASSQSAHDGILLDNGKIFMSGSGRTPNFDQRMMFNTHTMEFEFYDDIPENLGDYAIVPLYD